MLDGLVDWLKELTVFMVICETVLSFSPSIVYKRYIKPFVGLIVLLRITSFLFGAIEIDWNQRIDEIFSDYEQSASHYLENMPVVETGDAIKNSIEEMINDDQNTNNEKLNENIINVDEIIISPIKVGEVE